MLYRLNLVEDDISLFDEEGVELPDLETARLRATEAAREIIADEVIHGRLSLGGKIQITDESGELLMVVPFSEAVWLH